MLLKNQIHAAPQRGLPVDDKGSSSSIVSVTGETVQFYYSAAGVLTIDAGQAAGVAVVAQLAFNNVKNALGNLEATKSDTSLSFSSTAFTSEVYVDFEQIENLDATTFANRLSTITSGFSNGQYCVDYSNGTLYGVKASTQVTLTSTAYKYQANSVGSVSTAITSIVPGTGATNLGKAEDAAHASGDVGIEILAKRTDSPASSASTDGDYATVNEDANGNLWSTLGSKISGEDQVNDVTKTQTQMSYTNISASALIKSGAGQFGGITINSCGAGATIKVWDQTSAAVPVMYNTVTYTAAVNQGTALMTPPPGTVTKFGTGLYVTISGTMDATVSWN